MTAHIVLASARSQRDHKRHCTTHHCCRQRQPTSAAVTDRSFLLLDRFLFLVGVPFFAGMHTTLAFVTLCKLESGGLQGDSWKEHILVTPATASEKEVGSLRTGSLYLPRRFFFAALHLKTVRDLLHAQHANSHRPAGDALPLHRPPPAATARYRQSH